MEPQIESKPSHVPSRGSRPLRAPWRGPVHDAIAALESAAREGWEEEYAYSLGLQAYVYGFPWIYLSQLRWLWTTEGGKAVAKAQGLKLPWAPLNTFWNSPELATPDNTTGGSPNHDTLYSVAWLDLAREPQVLSVPAVTDRFYCMQMACMDSDNFAYIGTRSTGTAKANYLIGGPGWTGEVPQDVLDVLPRSRMPAVLIFGRTGVNNASKEELERAQAIQKGYKLTPLSRWRRNGEAPDHPTHVEIPVGIDYNDTRGAWITMNRAMTENPPGASPGIDQAELLRLFATIGVGPGQRLEDQSPATLRGLQRAAQHGLALLKKMTIGRGKTVNNWVYPPPTVGRAGQASDFITRGAIQALAGIADHDPIEAVYINTAQDADGQPLDAAAQYAMTFDPAAGGFPGFDPTYHGFWSVTMYDMADYNLVKGSTNYTINSYDPKYQTRKEDGSLTVLIQRDQPATPQKGAYWLQTPPPSDSGATSAFYLILRVYVPEPEISLTQTWEPPLIQRMG
jgi:hypothetical protein